jgi:hypothetical protein
LEFNSHIIRDGRIVYSTLEYFSMGVFEDSLVDSGSQERQYSPTKMFLIKWKIWILGRKCPNPRRKNYFGSDSRDKFLRGRVGIGGITL